MNMKKQNKNKKEVKDVIDAYTTTGKQTDPNGSYTGNPEIKSEVPVQDADDL